MSVKDCPFCGTAIEDAKAVFCAHCGESLAGPTTLADGRYVLKRCLGSGGMGKVFLADDTRLDVQRAIKLLEMPDLISENDRHSVRERMMIEARAAQRLGDRTHHAVQVYDVGLTENQDPYLVMEYLDGRTLTECLAQGPLDVETSLVVAEQILDALAAAHDAGMIHRDLKPDNIMLVQRQDAEFVKLLDFGLAKLTDSDFKTQTGVALGTLPYMAPEQIRGTAVDERSDLYAFGGVLYEMLTGKRANPGQTQSELLAVLLDRGVEPITGLGLDLPDHITQLVDACLNLDPGERPRNTAEVQHRLFGTESAAEGPTPPPVPIPTIDLSVQEIHEDRSPHGRAILILSLVAMAGLAVLIGLAIWRDPPPDHSSKTGMKSAPQLDAGLKSLGKADGNPGGETGVSQGNPPSDASTKVDVRSASDSSAGATPPGPLPAQPKFTLEKRAEGWHLRGTSGADIHAGLVMNLVNEPAATDQRARWARLPPWVRGWLASHFIAVRPTPDATELRVSKDRLDALKAQGPKRIHLPRIGKLWVSRERAVFYQIVNCRSLREGDTMVTARWRIRGYSPGQCRGTNCVTAVAQNVKKATTLGESLRLRITVERRASDSERPTRLTSACNIRRR